MEPATEGRGTPLSLPRTAAWVWHAEPRSIFGLDAVFVRCANGTSTTSTSGDGFDFADNYRRWQDTRGPAVVPWTWFGPPASSDGTAAADLLCQIGGAQPLYVVEIGFKAPAEEVVAFAKRMRERQPAALLGFSTYPTRAEATANGVPWDVCVAVFDLGLPQVYTAKQRLELLRPDSPVVADMAGKPIHVVVCPDSDPGWLEAAKAAMARHAGVSAWAVDQASFTTWRRHLSGLADERPAAKPPSTSRSALTDELPATEAAEEAAPPSPSPLSPGPGPVPAPTPIAAGDGGPAPIPTPPRPAGLEPGAQALLANRIIAIVQAHLDAGGTLSDDQLLSEVERALGDATAG
ncbi:MAG TPA: hypothetical protein VF995_07085 [Actinomycetota bacterium]